MARGDGRGKKRGESGDGFLVAGLCCEVACFVRVLGFVVEFGGVEGVAGAIAPQGETPFGVADAVAHERFSSIGARVLADGHGSDRGVRVVENGLEADAVEAGGDWQAADVGEGGVEVDELGERFCFFSGCLLLGDGDEKGRAHGDFEVGVFVPEAVFAELPAVIAPQDDDGVFVEALSFQGVEHATDLGVHVAG